MIWGNMHRGYIKLWRRVQDSFFYGKPEALALWIHLLLEANHKDHSFVFNGDKTICKRGQLITGLNVLSKRTGIERNKVYRFLKMFEKQTLIRTDNYSKFTLITILNYESYQDERTAKRTPVKRWRNAGETLVKTNNNDKNNKNEKNEKGGIEMNQKEKDQNMRVLFWYRETYGNDEVLEKLLRLNEQNELLTKEHIDKFNKEANIPLNDLGSSNEEIRKDA